MSAGILLLGLSCVAAYVYLFYLKPKAESQAATVSRDLRPSRVFAAATPTQVETGDVLEDAQVGDFLQFQDVGPQMLQISAQITHRHRAKTGFTRKTVLEGEAGVGPCFITSYPATSQQIWVTLQPISAELLPISKAQLQSLTADTDCTVVWEGVTYTFNGKESRLFCPDGNELEAEEQTSWRFHNRDAALDILRNSQGQYSGVLCAALHRQQVSLLKKG
jgi:hypothetical protein